MVVVIQGSRSIMAGYGGGSGGVVVIVVVLSATVSMPVHSPSRLLDVALSLHSSLVPCQEDGL